MNKLLTTTLMLLLTITHLVAQNSYKIGKQSIINVKGTSTLHDWEMKSADVTGTATFHVDGSEIKSLDALSLSLPAESIKSDKEAMDKNAYKALKTSQNKSITFQLTRVIRMEKTGNAYAITCEGKLQIAGTTNTTQLNATCQVSGNGALQCKGEKTFKMTEYKVEPPSFMFGSVKTGEEVTIHFDVTLTKS